MRTTVPIFLFFFFLAFTAFAQGEFAREKLELSIFIDGIGEIFLLETESDQTETTQLILKKPGGMREVIDSYEGLLPSDLIKQDLDADGKVELLVLLRIPDGMDVIPHIYSTISGFKRIFPSSNNETNPLVCREVFISTYANQPAVCTRHLVAYHDFGPPELFRLEFYRLQKNNLELVHQGFSKGDHFNIRMNKGAYAFHNGQYLEALDEYNLAISSSSGDITSKAFIEATFYLAESRKFSKDFKSALELYQKIVLELSNNQFTDQAQREIELISSNLQNLEALSFYVDVTSNINCDRWETALELLEQHPLANSPGALQDRFLFIKAEVLTALNRVEEAIKVYHDLKTMFPDSSLIESVDTILEDMEEKPEETDGL